MRPAARSAEPRPASQRLSPAGGRPDLTLEPGRLSGGRGAPVVVGSAEGVKHRPRGGYERARGPARERAGDIRRARALRTDAWEQQHRPGKKLPSLADRAGMSRSDDCADAGEAALAHELLAPLRNEPRDVLPERAPVREREILDVPDPLVRGLHQA